MGMADTEMPVWDEVTLQLAKAVGRGHFTINLDPPTDVKDGFDVAVWLAELRSYFPFIQVNLSPIFTATAREGAKELLDVAESDAESERKRHSVEMGQLKQYAATHDGKIRTQETLHDALDAYVLWLHQEHRDEVGDTTATGIKQGERAIRVKRHVKDMPLSDFGQEQIDALFDYWRKRPRQKNDQKKKNGQPFSHSVCKNTITLIKHFLRWLHKEKTMPWKRPEGLDLSERIKITKDSNPKFQAETYDLNEVKILWSHATTFERKLLLFALNFGASISECSTLDWEHVVGDHVERLRTKTKVYGQFVIWPLTKEAMGESKAKGRVLLNSKGNPLHSLVKSKQSRQIRNAWIRLLKRVRKHHDKFKLMGFHGMRRTAIQFIRDEADGETAGVFACHREACAAGRTTQPLLKPGVCQSLRGSGKSLGQAVELHDRPGNGPDSPKVQPGTDSRGPQAQAARGQDKVIAAQFGMSESQVRHYARQNPTDCLLSQVTSLAARTPARRRASRRPGRTAGGRHQDAEGLACGSRRGFSRPGSATHQGRRRGREPASRSTRRWGSRRTTASGSRSCSGR